MVDALAEAHGNGAEVEITFDDGNTSDVEHALPALLERDLTASFHVCAGRVGHPGYLGEDALLHLREAGMGIGSHGWHHVDLRTLPSADLVRATRDSQARLSELCGIPVTSFAVPMGSYDRRVLGHLGGYETVYTSDTTSTRQRGRIVPRWSYVQGWTARTVSDLARGVEPPWHRARQRASMVAKRWR